MALKVLFLIYALEALCPRPFCAARFDLADFDIAWLVVGVLLDTRFVGRQYSVLSFSLPQGRPVFVLIHLSDFQRFSDFPASVLRTLPRFLRHFAIACEARADGNTLYVRFA